MKTFVSYVVIFLFSLSALHAQQVMDQSKFESYLEELQMIKTPAGKMEFAMKVAEKEYFFVGQIQEMALMLPQDNLRYQFALLAFEHAVNPRHYYTVLDAFELKSTAFRFADAVRNYTSRYLASSQRRSDKSKTLNVSKSYAANKKHKIISDDLNYPDVSTYDNVNTNCGNPISSGQFQRILDTLKSIQTMEDKTSMAKNIAKKNCLSTAQIMKIGNTILDEEMRYSLFTTTYDYVYDADNFAYVKQLLASKENKKSMNEMLGITQGPVLFKLKEKAKKDTINYAQNIHNTIEKLIKPLPDSLQQKDTSKASVECKVPTREMNEIITVLMEIKMESDRLVEAKKIIKLNKCFTTEQIIRIIKSFEYENSRLNVAKYAYKYTKDQKHYDTVLSMFESDASKEELNTYLKNQ
ncbi:MAG: DUF4476 domain-containing protein [Bacteroidota bacterium]|nr:DUF4476 domain-containing protein [Bacteroidota bacterium]